MADENVYQLFPFMNQYAATNMLAQDKHILHGKIARHYAQECRELLKAQLEVRLNRLVSIETNIWACIYRMRDSEGIQARSRSPGLANFYS